MRPDAVGCLYRDRYRRRSPSPRGYRGRDSYRDSGRDSYRDSYRESGRDSYRRRSPVAPYYNRPRRTPPRSGTTLFVAGLNFVTTERVRLWSPQTLCGWQCEQRKLALIVLGPGLPLPDALLGGGAHQGSLLLQEVEAKFEKFGAVKEARIVRNPVNGESRGFGFVAMKYEEDVDAVSPVADHFF